MNSLVDDDITGPRPPVFVGALRHALGRTAIGLACWLVTLFLALVTAVPWRGSIAALLGQRYEPHSVLASMDEGFRFDHRTELGALRENTAGIAATLAFVTMLFGVFTG